MKYFRVKYGYGKGEFVSVDETEYRRAVTAQGTGGVAVFNNGTISGNNIMSITPDYQKVMGWNREYELTGEDYEHIGTRLQEEYRTFMKYTRLVLEGKTTQSPKGRFLESVETLAHSKSVGE